MGKLPHFWLRMLCLLCIVGVLCGGLQATAVNETAAIATFDAGDVTDESVVPQIRTTVVRRYGYRGAEIIGQMEDGTPVSVLESSGAFYWVDCYEMKGYIAASQLTYNEEQDTYYVNCREDSSETQHMVYTPPERALQLRSGLLELAQDQLGTPYVYGGSSPGGFDCSGLMYYLYGRHGISLQRRASLQLADGIVVPRSGMQVGDLVFFKEPWDSTPASHVGIYAGNNQIIHAGSQGIVYADLNGSYFADYFLGVRRIVNTGAAATEAAPAAAVALPVARSVGGRRSS